MTVSACSLSHRALPRCSFVISLTQSKPHTGAGQGWASEQSRALRQGSYALAHVVVTYRFRRCVWERMRHSTAPVLGPVCGGVREAGREVLPQRAANRPRHVRQQRPQEHVDEA